MTDLERMEMMAYFDKRIGTTTKEEDERIKFLLNKEKEEKERIEKDIKIRVW